MIFLYISIAIFLLILIRIIDRLYQRSLMKKFMQGERRLSPVSRRILNRWHNDYHRLQDIADKIDTNKLNPEDRKNLAIGVEALNFFYNSIEPTIGTGVRRYKIRISKMLQNAAHIIVEISKRAAVTE